jgi:ABC-2 type transport system permease protein
MNHPLYQLILARVREFTREPEAMFWTYGFPLAMAIALGIAFRERPVERVSVDVTQESAEIAIHLREIKSLKVEVYLSQECLERLRTGKTDVVVNETNNGYTFHYDQAKPTSVLARNAVNDALQRYAGQADPKVATDVILKEPGGRYIDRFPDGVQPYLRMLPLTPLIDAIRSVMLEGATLSSLSSELGSMLIWSAVSFALALKFFRWG